MEFLNDIDSSSSQNIRQDEINGKQHAFHSYPKELQAWHNNQYMLEKKVPIDESTVPESLLNGYMWQVIGDASQYGLASFFALIFAVIKLKLSPTVWGLAISLLIFMPWALYAMYHFVFYAKIRAQVVGPVTIKGYKYTSKIYYDTYFSIIISMAIAFLFVFQILDDILIVIRDFIVTMDPGSMAESYLKGPLTSIYNFFIELLSPPEGIFAQILWNQYITTFFFLGIIILSSYLFEKHVYNDRRSVVDQEIIDEENLTGYPIDSALKKIHEWRENN